MFNVFRKIVNYNTCEQGEKCCKKEMTYEEVIKRYEELSTQ